MNIRASALMANLAGLVVTVAAGIAVIAAFFTFGGASLGFWILSLGPFDPLSFAATLGFFLVGLLCTLVAIALFGAANALFDIANPAT